MAEFMDIMADKDPLNPKIKGKVNQGGTGCHSYCSDCNNFLGTIYVNSYRDWAEFGMLALQHEAFDSCSYTIQKIKPNKVLKQIISMFIAINEPWFGKEYKELVEFVRNPKVTSLSDRYRVFTYLKRPGQIRFLPFTIIGSATVNDTACCVEIAFKPYGYVLTIDDKKLRSNLLEITDFKNFNPDQESNMKIEINCFETNLQIPLDFRSRERIAIDLNSAEEE